MPIGSCRPAGTGGWSSGAPPLTPSFALLPGTADRVETPVTCRKQAVGHASTRDDSDHEFHSPLPGPFSGRNAYTSRNQTLCAQIPNAAVAKHAQVAQKGNGPLDEGRSLFEN